MLPTPRLFFMLLLTVPAGALAQRPGLFAPEEPPPPPPPLIDCLFMLPARAPMYAPRDDKYVPPDDAPAFELLAFWGRGDWNMFSAPAVFMGGGGNWHSAPTATVRRRLLTACLEQPGYLGGLVNHFPQTEEAYDAVKAWYDRTAGANSEPVVTRSGNTFRIASFSMADARKSAHDWLMMHSRYFREDLFAAAKGRAATEEVWDGNELDSLATLDWKAAEPMLQKLAASSHPDQAAWAMCVQYRHAISAGDKPDEVSLRDRLKQVAADRDAVPAARQKALEPLLTSNWDGRDEWAMSLLDDPIFAGDSYATHDALAELIARKPDRCIPLLARIAANSTGDSRKAAVDRLMRFKRADALRPLLPCLTDPQWSDHVDRHKLLTRLSEVDLPESVPFLMKLANSDDDSWRPSVVLALLHQHAPEADKVFRRTIEKMGKYIDAIGNPDWTDRVAAAAMAQLAVDRGMISDEQIVKAIEASLRNDGQGNGGLFKPDVDPSPEANLGMALAGMPAPRAGIADKLFDRSLALRKTDSATAEAIWALVGAWPDNAVDRRLVILLSEQPLSLAAVTTSMTRADSMRFVVGKVLRALTRVGGERAGVAAALLEDAEVTKAILQGPDVPAKRMLLACARLARVPLSEKVVGPLLKSDDAKVAHAAERYLMTEDTPQARELLWAHHPGAAIILGADWCEYQGDGQTIDPKDDPNEPLALEMRARNAPDEMYVMSGSGALSGDSETIIVRVRGKSGALEVQPWNALGKSLTREMTSAELKELTDFIAREKFEELPQLESGVCDGVFNYYLHFTRAGGAGVLMHNPGYYGTAGSPHLRLLSLFRHLAATGTFELHYFQIANAVPGMRVVFSNSSQPIAGIWKQGDRYSVLIGDIGEPKTWHALKGEAIAESVAPPAGFVTCDPNELKGPLNEFNVDWRDEQRLWKSFSGDKMIFAASPIGVYDKQGVYAWRAPDAPVQLTDLAASTPVTTFDGRWVVACINSGVVSINAASGKVRYFRLPADRSYTAQCFIPVLNKILVEGTKVITEEKSDTRYWLVDPATLAAEPVQGDLQPLIDSTGRLLASPSTPDEVWLTLNSKDSPHQVEIVRYNVRTFTAKRVFTLPSIYVTNDRMVINESAIDIAVNGDLLRLPLPAGKK